MRPGAFLLRLDYEYAEGVIHIVVEGFQATGECPPRTAHGLAFCSPEDRAKGGYDPEFGREIALGRLREWVRRNPVPGVRLKPGPKFSGWDRPSVSALMGRNHYTGDQRREVGWLMPAAVSGGGMPPYGVLLNPDTDDRHEKATPEGVVALMDGAVGFACRYCGYRTDVLDVVQTRHGVSVSEALQLRVDTRCRSIFHTACCPECCCVVVGG